MLEIESYRQAKRRAVGPDGLNDVPMKRVRRIDASSPNRATEVERSGDPERIRLAVLRLKNSERQQKILQVPHSYVPLAAYTMWNVGVSGTVKNLSGTKTVRVRKQAGTRHS